MERIGLLLLMMFIFSCKAPTRSHEKVISKIQSSNFKLFNGITIEARFEKDGVVQAPFLEIEINGTEFLLPNFKYYGCEVPTPDCFNHITKKFDIAEFNTQFNKDSDVDGFSFVYDFTFELFKEFERINIFRIVSNSWIGDCIIFDINENDYLAYVPDIKNVKNEFWKSKFIEANKIDEHWYAGTR
jgi:hypothetical protein